MRRPKTNASSTGTPAQHGEPAAAPSAGPFAATHVVPAEGLPVWQVPDGRTAQVDSLAAGLPVLVAEQRPDGWAQVVGADGRQGWVDGRRLVALPPTQPPPLTHPPPPPAEADPEMAATTAALDRAVAVYEGLLADLRAERIDFPTFRRRAAPAGVVEVDGVVWILDLENGQWVVYDGIRLFPTNLITQAVGQPESGG